MSAKFIRTVENFTCLNCGKNVRGNGYTNHCPECLYSLHVDNFPGDRASDCGGMMRPVRAYLKKGRFRLVHRCVKCGIEKHVKTADNDSFDEIIVATRRSLTELNKN